VLLAGERVALNLIQHLSAVATRTNQYVQAVEGTKTQIVDSREATPGLRMLERYAVVLGGGISGRFGLDDGVVITSNHCVMSGGIEAAVKSAKEKLGHLHRIAVHVSDENDIATALEHGADALVLENVSEDDVKRLIARARELSTTVSIECGGGAVTVEAARAFADAGADRLSIGTLSYRAPKVSFQMSAF
jgi:nicotinate-nucleotide pyrophosphorylase (carboxylating)